MDLWNWIQEHKDCMNVTGAEKALADQLRKELDPKGGHSAIDDTGCLFVQGNQSGTVITAMMDVPGYLVLQKYPEKSVIVYTLFNQTDRGDGFTAIGPDGKTVKVYRDKDPDSLYYIKQKRYGIGTPVKEVDLFSRNEEEICGINAARYALLYVLCSLSANGANCLFASRGFSGAPVEYNFCMRHNTGSVIMLGSVESDEERPIVLIKNGKHFSDRGLVQKAINAGFTPMLSNEAVTKAQRCADSGVDVLTLALPYRLTKKCERIVRIRSVEFFLKSIQNML